MPIKSIVKCKPYIYCMVYCMVLIYILYLCMKDDMRHTYVNNNGLHTSAEHHDITQTKEMTFGFYSSIIEIRYSIPSNHKKIQHWSKSVINLTFSFNNQSGSFIHSYWWLMMHAIHICTYLKLIFIQYSHLYAKVFISNWRTHIGS